ncbi:hypothetical protein CEXT_139141 [Caerostris extrusa]|uniref:Uncharacterized protein n=1 Tax=Caerostris extrusa TaxID=172846 RepID=A0AAV4UAC7_CAEEX|nr:hypothetical protein CEXT_139141 [Caerostris extrusa]
MPPGSFFRGSIQALWEIKRVQKTYFVRRGSTNLRVIQSNLRHATRGRSSVAALKPFGKSKEFKTYFVRRGFTNLRVIQSK